MVFPTTAFISTMNPRWRFPLRPLRMCAETESESSLSRLREVQRAILQRRSRFSRPPAPSSPEVEASSLFNAIFQGAIEVPQDVPLVALDRKGGEVESESGVGVSEIAGLSGGGEEEGRRAVVRKGDAKIGKDVDIEEAKGGEVDRVVPGLPGAERKGITSSKNGAVSKRPRPGGTALGVGNSSASDIIAQSMEHGRMFGTQKRGANDIGEGEMIKVEETGRLIEEGSKLVLMRGDGSLPWKSGIRRGKGEGEANYFAEGEFTVPLLEEFTTGAGLTRGVWKLPKRGWKSYSSSPKKATGMKRVYQDTKNSNSNHDVNPPDCEEILSGLNNLQRLAVLADPNKACLVLAGPGSGKTRVLTHRIAYLVQQYDISPFDILAVTFTNKAAAEMKERVSKLLGVNFAPDWAESGPRLSVGTFHSICARILRRFGEEIGISSDFDICDTSDSRKVVSRILRGLENGTPDASAVRMSVASISKLKNDRSGTQKSLQGAWPEHVYKKISEIRSAYDQELRSMNKLDFDDILLETRNLLESSPTVLGELHEKYEHVLVDEWQDTNHVQFDIVSMLAGKKKNVFVVGDADQSIYKFRGADSGNLDRFGEMFPDALRVALEYNYRSSAAIVGAAQAVIEGDISRPEKKMTTLNSFGNKVLLRETNDDRKEAHFVVSSLAEMLEIGAVQSPSDIAILYRTNAQSRLIEEACVQRDIPYRLLSGTKFYDRREIRDLMAYLKLLSNPADNDSFRRIVNVPPRGLGRKTIEELEKYSSEKDVPLLRGLELLVTAYEKQDTQNCNVDLKRNAMSKLADFRALFKTLLNVSLSISEESTINKDEKDKERADGVDSLLKAIVHGTNYTQYLEKGSENEGADGDDERSEKAQERLDNVKELLRAASRHKSLRGYLESATLMEKNTQEEGEENDIRAKPKAAISLMTLHGGKGLEFDAVFIIGAEDNVIPISRSREPDEIEEERRLLYVGMTRAKQHLTITWRANKMAVYWGKSQKRESSGPSRFLDAIPDDFVKREVSSKTKLDRLDRMDFPPENYGSTQRGSSKRGRKTTTRKRISLPEVEQMQAIPSAVSEWKVGDSVRCGEYGRGTITVGAPQSVEGAFIEVLFADGRRHYVHTGAQQVELLFSPS